MKKENKKRGVKVLIISIIIVLILALALSYAYFRTELNGSDQIVKVGELELVLDETSEGINLSNTVGISDSEGMSLTPSSFKLINNGNKAVDYIIYLDDNEISESDTRIDDKYLKYNLNKNGENSGARLLTTIGSNPNRILDSGTIEGKGTNEYSLGLWITSDVDGNYSNQVFSGKLRVEVKQERPTAVSVIKAKANAEDLNYNDATEEQKNEMWTFSHEATEQTEALTDYRYIGSTPDNYVKFNNETWRIIGVFTVDDGTGKKEERLKIIKYSHIGKYSFDNKDTTTGAETDYGESNWQDARLNYLLNPGHENETVGGSLYWNSESGNCYAGDNNDTTPCDFSTTGLKEEARAMIDNAVWYLSGFRGNAGTASECYTAERSTNIYNSTTSPRAISWIGKVGLMYPSDYGYAASGNVDTSRNTCLNSDLSDFDYPRNCALLNWLQGRYDHKYSLTPDISRSNYVRYITEGNNHSSSHVSGTLVSSSSVAVYPVVYLRASVKITGGDGSSSNAYILEL